MSKSIQTLGRVHTFIHADSESKVSRQIYMDDEAENKRGERKQTKRGSAGDTKCALLVVLTYYEIFVSQVSHRHGLLHVMKSLSSISS